MLVWPDLVYTELIAMVVCTLILVVWAVVLKAPLEQPASSARIPNPSKAPWYFLGLQEMLVYFDPWMAGVVLPTMIIVGLIAMPYIDFNQKGNGYFTFAQRKFAVTHVPVRLRGACGCADRARHLPARPELELLRPVRAVGPAQERAAEQRQPVGLLLAVHARHVHRHGPWYIRELPGIIMVLAYLLLLPPLLGEDDSCGRSSSAWASSASSCW